MRRKTPPCSSVVLVVVQHGVGLAVDPLLLAVAEVAGFPQTSWSGSKVREQPAVLQHRRGSSAPRQPQLHFCYDVRPLLGRSQGSGQLLERGAVHRRELEPGEEIERLAKIPAVVQPSRDPR